MSLIEEIARRTGVSKITVSRVLNGDVTYVRPTFARRAEQIRAIAAQLDYRPNSAARAISTGRFRNVGLLVPAGAEGLPRCLLRTLIGELGAHRLSLMLGELPPAAAEPADGAAHLLRERCVDGLLVQSAPGVPEPAIERVRRERVPTVWMNVRHASDSVHPDEDEAARRLVRTLVAAGHRRIAYLDARHGWRELPGALHFSVHARAAGHQAAMAEAGLPAQVVRGDTGGGNAAARALAHALLAARERPTAVVASRAAEAGALLAAANQLGIRVPDDLAIAAYVDEDTAPDRDELGLPLLLAQVPFAAIGRAATALLIDKLATPGRPLPSVAVPFGPLVG